MVRVDIVLVLPILFVIVSARSNYSSKLTLQLLFDESITKDNVPVSIEDVIKQMGYLMESHTIVTEDGYILTYHRIPRGRSKEKVLMDDVSKKPVLLQHGLFSSSACWVLSAGALAYSLADAGFDVWLGNSRGNTYSRKHVKYDPFKNKEEFWNFSWHEMGYYDIPASIDYILYQTNHSQLFYIGHSMGTTMYFVLGATRPEYMEKVQATITLAPVAFIQNIQSTVVRDLFKLAPLFHWMHRTFGIYDVFIDPDETLWFDQTVCMRPNLQFICRDFIFSLAGSDSDQLNNTLLPIILQYVPAGSSYMELEHFRQISISSFNQFDYGSEGNLLHYNSLHPPAYNLSKVNAPLHIYYGANDWLAVPQDVFRLVTSLPNVQSVSKVPYEKFNHIDFMWATDGKKLLYDDIVNTLLDKV